MYMSAYVGESQEVEEKRFYVRCARTDEFNSEIVIGSLIYVCRRRI